MVKAGIESHRSSRNRTMRLVSCLNDSMSKVSSDLTGTPTAAGTSGIACSEEQFFSVVINSGERSGRICRVEHLEYHLERKIMDYSEGNSDETSVVWWYHFIVRFHHIVLYNQYEGFELCALVGYKRQVGRRHGHTDQSSARSNLEMQPATSKGKSRRNPEVRREQHKGQCAAKDNLTIFRYRSGHCLRQIQEPHSKNHRTSTTTLKADKSARDRCSPVSTPQMCFPVALRGDL
ncbi:hypothetical protein KIN20_028484 [Parelaphostrongylus tenuis]|uniref:Uncharacterized protein n=1 Tax=Parelaphostrongylus tenuis TaxID=148309 RepID=A0AAD5WEQ9_PARTN|nr:hypothetical protein KIN20_028484 [Parelaphostrongylus tenuis]